MNRTRLAQVEGQSMDTFKIGRRISRTTVKPVLLYAVNVELPRNNIYTECVELR